MFFCQAFLNIGHLSIKLCVNSNLSEIQDFFSKLDHFLILKVLKIEFKKA